MKDYLKQLVAACVNAGAKESWFSEYFQSHPIPETNGEYWKELAESAMKVADFYTGALRIDPKTAIENLKRYRYLKSHPIPEDKIDFQTLRNEYEDSLDMDSDHYDKRMIASQEIFNWLSSRKEKKQIT